MATKSITLTLNMPVTIHATAKDNRGEVEVVSIDGCDLPNLADIDYTEDVLEALYDAWDEAGDTQ